MSGDFALRKRHARVGGAISAEQPVPKEVDHREIAVRVPVMHEVQFLHVSEPAEPKQPRSLDVIFPVEEGMGIERGGARDQHGDQNIEGKNKVGPTDGERHGQQEIWRIVALVIEIALRDQVLLRVMRMMKINVVAEKHAPPTAVAELIVQHRLGERHDQMRRDDGDDDRQDTQ